MTTFPSSIFSFDTLRPAGMPRAWVLSVVLAALLVGAAELSARILVAPLRSQAWAYWDSDAAKRFEEYRHMAQEGSLPPVVVIGDSLAARNFDPAAFSRAAGVPAYNMGWPGMFPLALDAIVLPLLEAGTPPRHVLLIQSPTSFIEDERVRRNEAPIVGSIQARRMRGETVPADYLALSKLFLARGEVAAAWRGVGAGWGEAPARAGFMPHMRPKGGARGPLGTQEVPPGELADARKAVVRRLLGIARERGFSVTAVVSPTGFDAVPGLVARQRDWLRTLEAEFPGVLTVWDDSGTGVVARDDFKDWLHLWDDAASRFSAHLGERFVHTVASAR
jgi:hypothetical protein